MVDLREEAHAAWQMLKATLEEWTADNTTRLAASLAYYTIFSIAPLLIIATAIAGVVLDRETVQTQIIKQIGAYINNPQTALLVQNMIKNASAPKANFFATLIGIIVLLYGATNVFSELKSSLNLIWDAPTKPAIGIRSVVVDRFLALLVVMVSGFLLLASLIVNTVLNLGTHWIDTTWPGMGMISQLSGFLFFFGVTLIVFALIYKFLPDIRIAWRDVWIGAVATTLLFSLGRFLISLYLSYSTIESTYGAAGSFVVLLLWIYYSAQIFFLGAQFTQVYGRTKGSRQREHALLQNSEATDEVAESEATDEVAEIEAVPTPVERQPLAKKFRPSLGRPLFDLVTAVGIIGAIAVLSLVRRPFRK